MADAFVQLAPDGSGKRVDNSSLTIAANTVYRQRISLGSDTATDLFATIKAASTPPVSADPALVVTLHPDTGELEPNVASYSAIQLGSTLPATPSDHMLLQGSNTKLVIVRRVTVSGIATTAGTLPIQILRRAGDNTGGTRGGVFIGKRDPNDPAATALCWRYTVNPTGLQGNMEALAVSRIFLPLATAAQNRLEFNLMDHKAKGLYLRGNTHFMAINMATSALPAGTALDVAIDWTEE